MINERAAIFNKAFKAYQQLVRNKYCFTETGYCCNTDISSGAFKSESSIIGDFVSSCCVFSEADAFTTTNELFDTYKAFCENNCNAPLGYDIFAKSLKEIFEAKGKQRLKRDKGRGYAGVMLKRTDTQNSETYR